MSKFAKYLLFTFISAWILMAIGIHDRNLGSTAGDMSFGRMLALAMFMPTLGVLFAGGKFRDMGWKPDFSRNWRLVLIAWFMPTVFQIAGAVLYYMIFPEDLELSGTFLREADPSAFEELEKSGSSYMGYVAKEIFYSLTSFYTFLAVFLGLGEEIGWRGFMFPALKEGMGRTRGLLIGGVIHGAWHFPVMLFAGYEYGWDYIGAPLLGLPVFCIFTVSTGVISFWLYERSESIWLPAIAHGAVNSAFNPYMLGGNERRTVFGPSMIGLIGVIPFAAFAVYLLCTWDKRTEYHEPEKE